MQAEEQVLKSRILHLPMAFDDKWTQGAIDKYMKSVRSEAPYLPSNIDFIALNNGLPGGRDAVREVVFSASYMVMGLGDVYLGAPCAVPVDPRWAL
jgi:urea carboxylase